LKNEAKLAVGIAKWLYKIVKMLSLVNVVKKLHINAHFKSLLQVMKNNDITLENLTTV